MVRRDCDQWRVLLLRAYNYWDCPKGVVEPGEEPLATARREVREETGIEKLDFRWGEEFTETPPYSKNKVARYYLAETSETASARRVSNHAVTAAITGAKNAPAESPTSTP